MAWRDQERIGYLRLEYLWSIVPYIALIRVEPGHRRQGSGKALLEAAKAIAREHGQLFLFSSSTGNEPEPLAWHRHMGFRPAGAITGINAGGLDEVFFRLDL